MNTLTGFLVGVFWVVSEKVMPKLVRDPIQEVSKEVTPVALKDISPEVRFGGSKCALGELISTLSKEDVETLNDWMASELSSAAIARTLTTYYGQRVPSDGLGRHRKGECRCSTASE